LPHTASHHYNLSPAVDEELVMPSVLNADENRDAVLRAQAAASRDFSLSKPLNVGSAHRPLKRRKKASELPE
jgi:hypothetical protein